MDFTDYEHKMAALGVAVQNNFPEIVDLDGAWKVLQSKGFNNHDADRPVIIKALYDAYPQFFKQPVTPALIDNTDPDRDSPISAEFQAFIGKNTNFAAMSPENKLLLIGRFKEVQADHNKESDLTAFVRMMVVKHGPMYHLYMTSQEKHQMSLIAQVRPNQTEGFTRREQLEAKKARIQNSTSEAGNPRIEMLRALEVQKIDAELGEMDAAAANANQAAIDAADLKKAYAARMAERIAADTNKAITAEDQRQERLARRRRALIGGVGA